MAIALRAVPLRHRWRLLRALGIDVYETGLESTVQVRNRRVSIGSGSYLNHGVLLEGHGVISIGQKVAVGPRAMILTSTHEIGPASWRAGQGVSVYRPVSVGDGTWIGAGAILLPGVSVGRGCVIAAGAVVVADCPDSTLWGGIPARQLRTLP